MKQIIFGLVVAPATHSQGEIQARPVCRFGSEYVFFVGEGIIIEVP